MNIISRGAFPAVLAALLTTGCTPTADLNRMRAKLATIQTRDGINREEARWLAQNFIVKNGFSHRLVHLKPHRFDEQYIWKKDGDRIRLLGAPSPAFAGEVEHRWLVYFRDRDTTILGATIVPFYVMINARTGEVMKWGTGFVEK